MTQQAIASVEKLAGGLSGAQRERLARYAALVAETGSRWNLMSRSALGKLDEHIIDSVAVLSVCDADRLTVADAGSGAGLPGIVLAIVRPAWDVTLIDSRRSKVVFLRSAVRELGLDNATVLHERIEAAEGDRFELVVSRALGSIERTLAQSLALVEPGGRLVLYKGPAWREERAAAQRILEQAGGRISSEDRVVLPGSDRTTTFVTVERVE